MSKPIVITGVAGFIGSNLADHLLNEGYRVVGIDNLAYGVAEQIPDGVEFHQLDIRDPAIYPLFEGGSVVFHLAAKNCIADCQLDPLETAHINVLGSVNVFEAARRGGAAKLVYAESASVYEGSSKLPTPETELAPRSFYAASKAAEMYFAEAYQRFSSLPMTALRYFGVYGPRQDYRRTIPPVMSAFILKLLKGERPTIYGSGEKSRDFIYVDDVNDFHLRCIDDRRTDGRVFNLGYGHPYSVNEIYARIAALLGVSVEPEHLPDLEGEAQTTHADITAAMSIGWAPLVGIDEGLRRSIAYIKTHVLAHT